ncbi:MAG: hypothetical protein IKI84_03115 [Clostridia bacterium]|nr:hypothetical protein [Clostridia bacterium]
MASLKEEARFILDGAMTGVAWLAIWKTGRTWHAEAMYDVEYTEGRGYPWNVKESWKIEADTAARLCEICSEDRDAILVNPLYDNLGTFEEMTLASLIDGIRFQYDFGGNIMEILRMAGKEDT